MNDAQTPSEPEADGSIELETQDDPMEVPLPLDTVFEILKNERRRLVLEYIISSDEDRVTTGELAEHIAAYENDIPREELNAQQRKRVYIGLYQCHLPKMDDADIVEFNQDRGHAALGPNAEQLYPYLDTDDDEESDPVQERLSVSMVALLLGGAVFLLARGLGATVFADLVILGTVVGVPVFIYRAQRLDEGD